MDRTVPDIFHLGRFVEAQNPLMARVLAELRAGRKSSHWMWLVFPQIAGLGHSPAAKHYAIASIEEAEAYLRHAVLGPRLLECTGLVNDIGHRSASDIFGSPDDMKFRSSMTLFASASPSATLFHEALARFFDGVPDARTLSLIQGPRR